MRGNVLYAVIGILVVAVGVLGWMVYDDRRHREGVEIRMDESGIRIERD